MKFLKKKKDSLVLPSGEAEQEKKVRLEKEKVFTEQILKELTEKYKGRTVLLSNGLTGEILEVTSFRTFFPEVAVGFDVLVEGREYNLSIDGQIVAIEKERI